MASYTEEGAMARLKSFDPQAISHQRKKEGLNQFDYWHRFGVTQSGGSRYESGRNIPVPISMLIWLFEAGRISEKDLADARKAINR